MQKNNPDFFTNTYFLKKTGIVEYIGI